MRTHKAGSKVCKFVVRRPLSLTCAQDRMPGNWGSLSGHLCPPQVFFCFVIFIFLCPSQGFFVFLFYIFYIFVPTTGFFGYCFIFSIFLCQPQVFFKFYSIYILCPPQCFLFCFSLLIFSFSFVVSIKTFCQIATWTSMLLSIFLFWAIEIILVLFMRKPSVISITWFTESTISNLTFIVRCV